MSNLRPGRVDRQEVHEPGSPVPGSDPGGQHRPDEGGGEVRVPPRLQVLDLRDLVDPPGRRAGDCRSVADDPHSGPHDREHQQADPHVAVPGAGVGPRADRRGDRRAHGPSRLQGAQDHEDRSGAGFPGDAGGRRGGLHLGDFIEDKNSPSPVDEVISANLREQTGNVLRSLSPREELVLRMRFGVGEGSEHTLEEVGKSFNVTRERIRQIESKALRKLRHPELGSEAPSVPGRRRVGAARPVGAVFGRSCHSARMSRARMSRARMSRGVTCCAAFCGASSGRSAAPENPLRSVPRRRLQLPFDRHETD